MDIKASLKQNFDQARNALDLNGLNAIREQSRETDGEAKKEALNEAAQQFEAIFMKMLLSSMRKAQEVLESDSPYNSQSTKFYRDMHDEQMAIELSSNGSLGLTDLIVRQLGGDDGKFKPSSVLRNDGNLTTSTNLNSNPFSSTNTLNSSSDNSADIKTGDVNSDKDRQHNSLIEKMIADQKTEGSDVKTPFAVNYQEINGVVSQHNNAAYNTQQMINNAADNNSDKVTSAAKSVNNSSQLSDESFKEPKDFVTALIEPAQKVQQELGVPFEVVIAQAALETGWGQKIIKDQDGESSNNLFNIKADSRWAGDKVSKDTLEFEQGTMVKKVEPFRTYQSINESIDDYINFLSTSDRYQEALQDSSNVEHFLQGLQKAGYATDPQYADKILSTLKTVTNLIAK